MNQSFKVGDRVRVVSDARTLEQQRCIGTPWCWGLPGRVGVVSLLYDGPHEGCSVRFDDGASWAFWAVDLEKVEDTAPRSDEKKKTYYVFFGQTAWDCIVTATSHDDAVHVAHLAASPNDRRHQTVFDRSAEMGPTAFAEDEPEFREELQRLRRDAGTFPPDFDQRDEGLVAFLRKHGINAGEDQT